MRHIFSILILFIACLTQGQIMPDVVLTTGHNDQINAMEITPNGQFLASASNDKQIKIWDIGTGMEYRTISGMAGRVEQLAFSSNNRFLAGTSFNEELLIWDIITGEVIHSALAGSSRGLSFSKDGNELFYINDDSQISVYDLIVKTTKVLSENNTIDFAADVEKGMIYSLDHLGAMQKISMSNGTTVEVYQLFDEFNFPFCNSDITPDGKFIAYGFNDDKLRIFNTEKGEFEFESRKYDSKIVSLTIDQDKPIVYISSHVGDLILFNYETKKVVEKGVVSNSPFSIQCVQSHPDGEIVFLANNDLITLYDFKRKRVFRQFAPRVSRIYNMAYDPTGHYLAVATDDLELKIWDLGLNRVIGSVPGFFPCEFTPDGKSIVAMSNQINLGLFDVESGKRIKTFDTGYELIQTVAISNDGKKLTGAGFKNKVKVWDIESTKMEAELEGHEGGILALDFHPSKPWIVSGSLDQTARIWDYEKKKELIKFEEQTISIHDVKFSPDGNHLATAAWDKTIYLRSTSDWSLDHILIEHVNIVNTIDYSADGTTLISGAGNNAVGAADNSVIVWDTKTGKSICQFQDHRGEIIKVICDPLNNRFFSASIDGAVKYSDYKTCELIATYQAIGAKEFMIYTPDNYYMASRSALQGIAFRMGEKLVPFDQFHIHLNRPDIVAQRIGKSSEKLINLYHYLYKKRLKKLNLDEGSLKLDFNLPTIKIESKYEIVTTEPSQKLWISAWDDDYNLKSLHVYVNNVPIYGEQGFIIDGNIKSIRKEIEIPLVNKKNKILISCMNSNGVESLYEGFEIIRDSDVEKHDLYIAAIGVSNYKDERFNLKYPTKDAQDILNKFNEETGKERYNEVHSKLLVNEAVTKEGIQSLGEFFSACTHEDFAIIFIAGHGVLNVDYDYFYGAYDMDFDSPDERGIPYTQISGILDKVKAYQKLLIMDTCHSGELDEDDIEEGQDPEVEQGDVQFRGVASNIRKKEGVGLDNSRKYTESLFSDITKGTGATVISSAGGAEYAMESDQWRNGLFTYVFIQGLSQKVSGDVYLSEIRAYVNREVRKLSNEKQIPTAREENINMDYIIFGN
ncbi:MAG: WD40 repeat protein [Crocinitomix sp.]|jgi:WD40 repeat protein